MVDSEVPAQIFKYVYVIFKFRVDNVYNYMTLMPLGNAMLFFRMEILQKLLRGMA